VLAKDEDLVALLTTLTSIGRCRRDDRPGLARTSQQRHALPMHGGEDCLTPEGPAVVNKSAR